MSFTFEEQMAGRAHWIDYHIARHVGGMDGSAEFAEQGTHRVRLTRTWDKTKPVMTVCGKNPSRAGAHQNDPTIHRTVAIGTRLGYGGLIMVNADTYIATDPKQLYAWWATLGHEECFRVRRRAIETAVAAAGQSRIFIAAWGSAPGLQDAHGSSYGAYYRLFREELEKRGVVLHHLGLNADGSPRHPIARGRNRIPDDQQPVRWTA